MIVPVSAPWRVPDNARRRASPALAVLKRNDFVKPRTFLTLNEMLQFPGGIRRNPAIDAWLNERPPQLRAIARTWFLKMRDCGDDVQELLHDHHPTACVDDVAFGYVNVFTAHVNVGFFFGFELEDPMGLLEGTGRRMRHVKLRPNMSVDDAALSALITAAYVDVRARLEAARRG
jgi:hypothetical protein